MRSHEAGVFQGFLFLLDLGAKELRWLAKGSDSHSSKGKDPCMSFILLLQVHPFSSLAVSLHHETIPKILYKDIGHTSIGQG
jgi:hypothetical protein